MELTSVRNATYALNEEAVNVSEAGLTSDRGT
jgi:hypothetical protein